MKQPKPETVELNWQGPIPAAGFVADWRAVQKRYPELSGPGIYLWCVKKGGIFVIVYVGMSTKVLGRLCTEMNDIKEWQSVLLNLPARGPINDAHFNYAYVPDHDSRKGLPANLGDRNLARYRIFFARLNKMKRSELTAIEGAIQLHLRGKTETRRYLITGVSSYGLRGTVLMSNCPCRILGLEEPITTPPA
jgi:hypothetical protein